MINLLVNLSLRDRSAEIVSVEGLARMNVLEFGRCTESFLERSLKHCLLVGVSHQLHKLQIGHLPIDPPLFMVCPQK